MVAVIALLALPKLNLFGDKKNEPAATGPRSAAKLPVQALIIKTAPLDNKLMVTGSVLANESLELKSEESGKITGLFFKEGKRVKKGDLLLRINDEEIRAQLEKQVFNRKLYEDIEARQRRLLEKEAISQEEYDNALNRLNTTIADIKLLEAQLEKTRISAPFDGQIGLRYVSEGAYISPSTVIATLYNNTPAKIEFSVPGRYSTEVTPGKKILFTIENYPQKIFNGEVYAIEPRIDPETRTLKIRALADNTSGSLLPGQFVKVELILNTNVSAVLIPTEALVPEQGGQKVFIVNNGKAKDVKVETGIRTERQIEVTKGLSPRDTLITTGILQLREGLEVQIDTLINQ